MIISSESTATFTVTSETYVLTKVPMQENNVSLCEWALCPLIDRSEKGKDPDVGCPQIFVSDEEAEELKKAGFGVV